MKKLMGISVIAALAVLPVAANAAEGDQVQKLSAATVVSSQNLATTSYVQGAYKAAADKIDAVIDSTSIATNGTYIDAGKDVAHNLGELDTAVKDLADNAQDTYQLKANSTVADKDAQDNTITYNYIQSGTGVAANLVRLDTQAKTNATAISDEATARAQADTAINNTIGSGEMGTSATTVKGAIAEIDGKVDTLTADENTSGSLAYEAKARADADTAINTTIGTKASLNTTDKTDLVSAINEVNDAVSTLNTNAAATYQTLTNSKVNNAGNYLTVGQGVGANLEALDTAVGKVDAANQYHIATANDVATNLETLDAAVHTNDTAIATINNKQIPIVADWSTGTVTQKKISELVAAAN